MSTHDGTMNIDIATPLLAGLSPQQFMRRHWQRKPLLVRQAVPRVLPPVTRAEMFTLVGREDVESRLIVRDRSRWALKHGPFARGALPPLKQTGWTLLVQGLDLHVQSARALLDRFRFVPQVRCDDLMVSYASDRGGAGPHFDSYDVFLLQLQGQRRWRVSHQSDLSLRPGLALKILSRFEPVHDWVLQPGDMLYLPPHWAHEGVAVGADCMTCSIGMHAPGQYELGTGVLQRLLDAGEAPQVDRLYSDPQQPATDEPGRIPVDLRAFAANAVMRLVRDPQVLTCALGEVLSEPKPRVLFDRNPTARLGGDVYLDRRSRMFYDERRIYLNGESYLAGGQDARAMRGLADARCLDARTVARLSAEARALLAQWLRAGWLCTTQISF